MLICFTSSVHIAQQLGTFKFVHPVFCFRFLQFHSLLYGDASGWARRFNKAIIRYVPGVMNPHTRIVQKWNKFFVMSCSVAIFVDPLFFFLLSVQQVCFYLFLVPEFIVRVALL